ncbi:alkaline phosphatase family protein [Mycolicibacterium austroafricanum]|uniref:alkaline phosphatase family protein n=1 Tax=Mycolicibacterium austroafricanum TaxID=39687 RepID=UPI000CF850E6|nr:alkaline phosphatase family protein [Mycolicibacterium austroafricanum]PQP45758.1 phosphodiesterase [Mycolicibacterium austroafricanum]
MGYSNHIGRVGALAVTLGVGWAVASAPGVAHAEPSAPSASSESSSTTTASNEESSAKVGTTADDGAAAPGDEAEKEVAEADDEEVVDEDDDEVVEAEDTEAEDDAEAEDAVDVEDTVDVDVDDAEDAEAAVVTLVSDQVTSEPAPQPEPAPAAPMGGSAMLASLAAVRDELERNAIRRNTVATQVTALADETPNVLLIGVDGTNLSRVLANPATTTNFFSLIQNGTTAASTIVGHTTISNPSWSSILTGAWGEKTGVINNIFTPWTYEKWPTVFTQLETLDGDIVTTSIANWNVISGIADSGLGADTVVNVSQVEGDTNWLLTDDEVGDLTEAAIAAASADAANFMFSYFVGVDENGHLYGGDSPEYAAAVANFDRNLGEILQAVSTWEAATGEKWTIIMVTDHGHQAQKGLGHGFQSPDETSTFVIASNPELFGQGVINLKYSIVDVTPTVLSLFGFEPAEDSDGVPLTDLDDADVTPVDNDAALRGALLDIIGKYGYPDIGTTLALGARTIFASVPYYVDMLTTGITDSLQTIADAGIFLISPLAQLAIVPVKFVGDLAYVATNFVAQIVARLTGVTGASIFPLWPPAPPTFPESPEELSTPDLVALVCSDGRVSSAVFACGAAAVAV